MTDINWAQILFASVNIWF